jgi:hypothetical protein
VRSEAVENDDMVDTQKRCMQAVLRLPCGWGKCLAQFRGANLDFRGFNGPGATLILINLSNHLISTPMASKEATNSADSRSVGKLPKRLNVFHMTERRMEKVPRILHLER